VDILGAIPFGNWPKLGTMYVLHTVCGGSLKLTYRKVVVIDNLSNAFRSVFERIEEMTDRHYETQRTLHKRPSLQLYQADFRNQQEITAILKEYSLRPSRTPDSPGKVRYRRSTITGVIHFAAFKAVEESIRQPLKYYANNVGGLIEFCSLLGEFGIKRVVFSSSATVYGTVADRGVPLREEYCSQETVVFVDHDGIGKRVESGCSGLTNPYGRTKWMCEAILSDLAHSDSEWSITALRYFNPIGCDESGLLGEDPRLCATNLMPGMLAPSRMKQVLNICVSCFESLDRCHADPKHLWRRL